MGKTNVSSVEVLTVSHLPYSNLKKGMNTMKSLEELRALRASAQSKLGIRNDSAATIKVAVCMGTCGIAAGARPVMNAFTEEFAKRGILNASVIPTAGACDCKAAPVVEVSIGDEKVTYVNMTAEKAARVVAEHIVDGKVVAEYTVGAAK